MPTSGIRVLTIGKKFALPYDVRHIDDVSGLIGSLATFRPDVIVTSTFMPGVLNNFAFEWRKRWIHVAPDSKDEDVAAQVEGCHSFNLWGQAENEKHNPLISVYTGTKNTGDYLRETYQSLRDQGYTNWEWVVIDDASEDSTWKRLASAAKEDPRVRPFRSAVPLWKIGSVKDHATRLCRGEYLVELDHDDMLVDTALSEIVNAFKSNPDVGFVYSNASNFFENGTFHRFQDDFWKNRYRETEYRGRKWIECVNPDIYDRFGPNYWDQFGYFLTVGPNHVRAFRASTFRQLGGYNPNLPVADDWDLYARFFLESKCLHLDKMLYLYRFKDNWSNTTFTRNKSIQDHLALGRAHYASQFEKVNAARLKLNAPSKPGSEALFITLEKQFVPGRISVVLATRKRPGNVRRLVESARNTVKDFSQIEFCFYVDDDDHETVPVLDELKLKYKVGPRIPLSRAYNEAAKLATGEIFHCCADDVVYRSSDWDSFARREFEKVGDRIALIFGRDGHQDGKIPTHPFLHRRWIETLGYLAPPYFSAWYSDNWLEDLALRVSRKIYVPEIFTEHLHFSMGKSAMDQTYLECFKRSSGEQGLMKELEAVRIKDAEKLKKVMERPPAKLSDVSYIVLEAAPTRLTERCLESILRFSEGSEIVLVANGCDPTAAAKRLATKVVSLDANLGFAAGCNAGAAQATRPILCFMNNDAEFVDKLTPKLLVERMTETHPITAPFSNRAKPPQGDVKRKDVPSIDVLADMVVGLCMMIPKDLYNKLEGFDPRLLTYEDDDLCLRARRAGKACKVVGGTWVNHERHATFEALGLDVNAVMAENQKKYHTIHPKVRVAVIAKDEAGAIQGFFRQFEGITRDWCMLDTGSTDKTREIARSIGVRIEEKPFENFAEARNEALLRFREGADWIIMMDPDERLDPHTIEHLEELLSTTSHDILLSPLDAVYPDGSRKAFVPKPFAFRADPQISWIFKVHEKLIGSKKQAMVKNALIGHVISLHEGPRRSMSEGLYARLMKEERYFTDPAYKAKMREDWPILDYDRMDDPRIAKVYAGPRVSVVIATYNRKELLGKAIASALAQDYENLEIIVVGDNCPSLNAAEISGGRIRAVNLPKNHGAGGAVPRNYGIMLSSGGLIAYLDDDNEWTPGHVSSLYDALRSAEASYAFSSMQTLGKGLIFLEPKRGSIDTSCVLHKKELIRKHGWWKDRIEAGYAHDWEFFSRWADEKWVATELPTLIYNAETSGQLEFLKNLIATSST